MKWWIIILLLVLLILAGGIFFMYSFKNPNILAINQFKQSGQSLHQESIKQSSKLISQSTTTDTYEQKQGDKITYTAIIHSSPRIYEDGIYKEKQDARSLKGSDWQCNVISDKITDVECLDYNYTSIKLSDIKILDDAKASLSIPIKIVSVNESKTGLKETAVTTITKGDSKEVGWINVPIGSELHIGDNSTTVKLTNTNIVVDYWMSLYMSGGDKTLDTTDKNLYIWLPATGSEKETFRSGFCFNTTSIPVGNTIQQTIFNVSVGKLHTNVNPNVTIKQVINSTLGTSQKNWVDMVNGITFNATNQDHFKALGYTAISMGPNMNQVIDDQVNVYKTNIVCFGISQTTASGKEGTHEGTYLNSSETTSDPELIVTYSDLNPPSLSNIQANQSYYIVNSNVNISASAIDTVSGLSNAWFTYQNGTSVINQETTTNMSTSYSDIYLDNSRQSAQNFSSSNGDGFIIEVCNTLGNQGENYTDFIATLEVRTASGASPSSISLGNVTWNMTELIDHKFNRYECKKFDTPIPYTNNTNLYLRY